MLRYKNSLLERILLEKGACPDSLFGTCCLWSLGIDVQAELKSKNDPTQISPHSLPPAAHQPSPIQRAVMNRHTQARRSASGIMKLNHAQPSPTSSISVPKQSPRLQPTPPSQVLSPTTSRSPVGLVQGGMISPAVDLRAQQQQQPRPKARAPPPQMPPNISTSMSGSNVQAILPASRASTSHEMTSATSAQSSYYPSPFQTHIEQLGKLTRPLLSRICFIELCSS